LPVGATPSTPSLEIQGVVLTMHDARTALSKEVAADVRAFFGPMVYETMIPRNVRVAEAPSAGKPIMLYDSLVSGIVRPPCRMDALDLPARLRETTETHAFNAGSVSSMAANTWSRDALGISFASNWAQRS
jgi:cellulose biosynthesis protein BcsQ